MHEEIIDATDECCVLAAVIPVWIIACWSHHVARCYLEISAMR